MRARDEEVTVRVVRAVGFHMSRVCVRPGAGAPVRAGAAAGVFAEGLRGRRGRSDGQTDPQRGPRLQSGEDLTPQEAGPHVFHPSVLQMQTRA